MIDHTLKLSLDSDRHLVVGDIHGRYETFRRLLDAVNYDPAKDIIYSVGDLIDRGPDSYEVLEFFQGERRYAVKGNHEHMALTQDWLATWYDNGGVACIGSLKKNNRSYEWLCDILRPLPWVIDVGEDNEEHAFRIVHAEHPPLWSDAYFKRILDEALSGDDPGLARLIWSRTTIQRALSNQHYEREITEDISFDQNRCRKVFVGHTPIKEPLKVGDTWFIDTWASGTMSLIDAVSEETWTVKYVGT